MTTGYILVIAVLILGGVIATLGDRIGMKVGKARLSLFRLRPRQTATLVSILTGSIISASTLALLFGVSRQLRTGVFELEQIQEDLSQAETDLAAAQAEKDTIEDDLITARQQQQTAQRDLRTINQSLRQALARQRSTQANLQRSQALLANLGNQLSTVSQQAEQLRGEIERLDAERTALLQRQATVQQELTQRDRQIAQRDREIAERQQRLSALQAQQASLQADVTELERQYEGLFRGSVAVSRNEPLISGLIRITEVQDAQRAVDQILRQANRAAIQQIAPGTRLDRQVLLISQEEVARLTDLISNRQTYVVRVVSEANYIIGEPCVVADADPCVQVYIDAALNEVIYEQNERLATVTVEPRNLTNQDLVEQLNLLIASLQFRARQDGVVGDSLQIAGGRTEALVAFLSEIKNFDDSVEIQAIAAEPIFTIGPLQIELFAVRNDRVLVRTDQLPRILPQAPVLDDPSTP